MPSLLPGHYAAVKVRKELYVTALAHHIRGLPRPHPFQLVRHCQRLGLRCVLSRRREQKGVVPEVRTKRWRLEDGVHSLRQRRRAVELYIKYGLKATATIRELGYPSRAQLVSWHREWQENGGRLTDLSLEQYVPEQKRAAVRHCPAHGRCDTPRQARAWMPQVHGEARRADRRVCTRREKGNAAQGVRCIREGHCRQALLSDFSPYTY